MKMSKFINTNPSVILAYWIRVHLFSKNSFLGSSCKTVKGLSAQYCSRWCETDYYSQGKVQTLHVLKLCPAVWQCAAFDCRVKEFYVLVLVSRNTTAVKYVAAVNHCEQRKRGVSQNLFMYLCCCFFCTTVLLKLQHYLPQSCRLIV